jgi:hypothetical protein
MEQIFVESTKSYKHGFVLKEQDLRRLVELMNEQFKKNSENDVEYNYTIKYKNGAVANTPDLESVLKQENDGSASIVRLEVNGVQTFEEKSSAIKVDFKNPDISDEESLIPIRHIIKGQSRDWVFITSSLIEERIGKIKRNQIDPTANNGRGRLLYKLFTPVFMLLLMIVLLISSPSAIGDLSDKRDKAINSIEEKWKLKEITDPIDAIIQLEKAKNIQNDDISVGTLLFGMLLSKPFIFVIIGLILIISLAFVFIKYYPAYNFYWGNYMEIFDKKESIRKLIIGILLGTIFLGIIVNLLSNVIWDKL